MTTEPTTAELVELVQKHGAEQVDAALHSAAGWQKWADHLHQLIADMPWPRHPTYMDECYEEDTVDLGVHSISRSQMLAKLHEVRMHADALSMAISRGARLVNEHTANTVRQLSSPNTH